MARLRLGSRSGLLWIVFAAAVLIRLVNVADIALQPDVALTEDAALYWDGARDWIASGGFNRVTTGEDDVRAYAPEHERVPGYFLFLLTFFAAFGGNPLPVLIAQSLLDAATCVLIASIGFRLSLHAGFLAGLLAALWPNMIIHSGLILTETLFLFLTVLLMAAALRFTDRLKLRDAWIVGLLCGMTIIVRPVMQFFPLALMMGAAILPVLSGRGWRIIVAAPILLAIGAATPVIPQLIRNQIVFGEPRLTSQTGVHLLYWVASQVEQIGSNTTFDALSVRYQTELEARFAERGLSFYAAAPFEQDRAMQKLAIEILADQPATAIAQAWMQGMALNLMAPAILGDPRIRSLKTESFMSGAGDIFSRARQMVASAPPAYLIAVVIGSIGSLISLGLAAAGFVVTLRRDLPLALLSVALIGYFLLITGHVAAPKYRIPFEPAIILACAAALAAAIDRRRRRQSAVPPSVHQRTDSASLTNGTE